MERSEIEQNFYDHVVKEFGSVPDTIERADIVMLKEKYGEDAGGDFKWPTWLTYPPERRVSRGVYKLGDIPESATKEEAEETDFEGMGLETPAIANEGGNSDYVPHSNTIELPEEMALIPPKMKGYIAFGNYETIHAIVKSKAFAPTYITGLSGNGKTLMVQQVCADLNREMFRCNITIETDEDDLLGGYRLVDGNTVWQDGPVVSAMKRGAVLLLDEVDLGSNKMMCLQPVLEGQGIYVKKINRFVYPEPGFNVIATANTKGRGSDDGRFIGANVQNEAFLDRYSFTIEQSYPNERQEKRILKPELSKFGIKDDEFLTLLTKWSAAVRTAFEKGATNDVISTRRLVEIVKAYGILGQDKEKAMQLCLARFDAETASAFWEFYTKIDANLSKSPFDNDDEDLAVKDINPDDDIPF